MQAPATHVSQTPPMPELHIVPSRTGVYVHTPPVHVPPVMHTGGVWHGSPTTGEQLPLAAVHVPPVWHPTGAGHVPAVYAHAPVPELHVPIWHPVVAHVPGVNAHVPVVGLHVPPV
jgi:hypothetical protein